MELIQESTLINATLRKVWDVVTDWEGRTRWAPGVKASEILDPGPIRKGSRIKIQVGERTFRPKVVDISPLSRIIIKVGRFPVWVKHSYDMRAENGEVTLTLGIQYGGVFGSIVGRKMIHSSRKELADELAGLRRVIESCT